MDARTQKFCDFLMDQLGREQNIVKEYQFIAQDYQTVRELKADKDKYIAKLLDLYKRFCSEKEAIPDFNFPKSQYELQMEEVEEYPKRKRGLEAPLYAQIVSL